MDNASRILLCLDRHLDHEVQLILYGRAAIQLGFPNAPEAVARSLDVDAIIPSSRVDALAADHGFWDAQQAANLELESDGLYITHLFPSEMVILRGDWLDHLVALDRPTPRHLRLFRPDTVDLVLTKMMRGLDPSDLEDAAFLCREGKLSRYELEAAFRGAVVPPIPEILQSFETCRPIILGFGTDP
ncbi:MAG: hypothetical protein RLZ45_507 [Verrucomicrobiota bacterium]|jgi:hypothetical protein